MGKPAFVILSGPPAAGKTTAARPLADALGYPLFAVDVVKERLAEAFGPDALDFADRLGQAALVQTLATAHELLQSGRPVMIESFFRAGEFDHLFVPLLQAANAVLIHVWADDLVLKNRYETRAITPDRHWIHGDIARLGTLTPELPEDMRPPLDLGISRIFVNTSTTRISIEDLHRATVVALESPQPSDSHLGHLS